MMRRDQADMVGKRENLLVSVICNLIIPLLILTKLSNPDRLGAVVALCLGLAFPLGYGIWDLINRNQLNFVSILGIISVGLSGAFGLVQVDPFWFAVKEASLPLAIGIMVLLTFRSKRPLIKTFLYNPQILNTQLIDERLQATGSQQAFNKIFSICNGLLIVSFLLSAALNYLLARMMVTTHPAVDLVEFNAQLGKMNFMSWFVIALPSALIMMIALWKLVTGLGQLTGLKLEQMLLEPAKEKRKGR
ncbi:MAG: MFS transporter [Opitutae bacterium]|nr:MFS transporter [Opitutae bacterium]